MHCPTTQNPLVTRIIKVSIPPCSTMTSSCRQNKRKTNLLNETRIIKCEKHVVFVSIRFFGFRFFMVEPVKISIDRKVHTYSSLSGWHEKKRKLHMEQQRTLHVELELKEGFSWLDALVMYNLNDNWPVQIFENTVLSNTVIVIRFAKVY